VTDRPPVIVNYFYYYYASKDAHFVKLPSYPFLQFWVEKRKKYTEVGEGKKKKYEE